MSRSTFSSLVFIIVASGCGGGTDRTPPAVDMGSGGTDMGPRPDSGPTPNNDAGPQPDAGPRPDSGPGVDAGRMDSGTRTDGGATSCTDTCMYAFDDECDDGRPGSDTDECAPGTDCTDCEGRVGIDAGPRPDLGPRPDAGPRPDLGPPPPDMGPPGPLTDSGVPVASMGIRVQLYWSSLGAQRGNDDFDLHVHRDGPPGDGGMAETAFSTIDDCYWLNCKWTGSQLFTAWGYADSADSVCDMIVGPTGRDWGARPTCPNPRLERDVIGCDTNYTNPAASQYCSPEIFALDNAVAGNRFRIMARVLSQRSPSGGKATFVIDCGGTRTVVGGDSSPMMVRGDRWRAADIIVEGAGTPTCRVVNLPATTDQTDDFGPAWGT